MVFATNTNSITAVSLAKVLLWRELLADSPGKLRPWMLSILKFTSKYFIEMIFTNDSKSVKFVELKTRENFELYSNSAMDS